MSSCVASGSKTYVARYLTPIDGPVRYLMTKDRIDNAISAVFKDADHSPHNNAPNLSRLIGP